MIVEFIKDFGKKKKGEVGEYDGSLAMTLIHKKVAKKRERKPKTTKKDK